MAIDTQLMFRNRDTKELRKDLNNNQSVLESNRKNWEEVWEDIGKYIIPMREYMEESEMVEGQRGYRHGTEIYDSTGVQALGLMADGLLGYMISPTLKWFRLRMRNMRLMDFPEVRRWLQDTEEAMYAEFRDSGFYEQMHQYLEDGGSIGTATMFITEDLEEDLSHFDTRHPIEMFIAENFRHKVDVSHRRFRLSARDAVRIYGKNRLSIEIQQASEKRPFTEFVFYIGIYPNYDRLTQGIGQHNMPWIAFHWEEKGNDIIRIDGYEENPAVIWRWKTNSHEAYGRSPAFDALVDVIGVNRYAKDMLQASHIAVDPPYNIPEEQRNRVRLIPRGQNFYSDASRLITPIPVAQGYPFGQDTIDKKQQTIKDHFMVDFFLMLSQQQRSRTATEVIELQGEKASVMGSMIGRLNSEALDFILHRVWNIMMRAGRVPEPPAVVQEMSDGKYEIEYVGILAQAQRKYFKSTGIIQSLQVSEGIMQIAPETRDWVDWDELIKELFEINSMPQKVIREEPEVAQIRQQRNEAIQRENQMAQLERMAEMTNKGSKAPEQGSPTQTIMEAL